MNKRELYQLEREIIAKSKVLSVLLSVMEFAVMGLFIVMTLSDKPVSAEYFVVSGIVAVMMISHFIAEKKEDAKKRLLYKKRCNTYKSQSMPRKQSRSAA